MERLVMDPVSTAAPRRWLARALPAVVILCLGAWVACGHGPRRVGSDGNGRVLERVSAALADLSRAYAKGDVRAFGRGVHSHYRLDPCLLRREVTDEVALTRHRRLSFMPYRIKGTRPYVEVACRWTKTYVIADTGQPVVERGQSEMLFLRGKRLLLVDVRGDLPFGGG